MVTGPSSNYGTEEEKNKIRKIVEQRGLAGVANTTKWNELLTFMRERDGWTPSFKTKWLINGYVSDWDSEWWYHPSTIPFVGVEWLDMRLSPGEDDSWITEKLKSIGLDHEKVGDIIRVWGYHPKSYDGLEGH